MKTIARFIYVAVAVVIITIGAVATSAYPINPGDVFVSFEKQGMGFVRHYDSNMNLLETLNTGYIFFATGMAFDGNGDLFVTNFNAPFISRFSHVDGSALPPWSTGRLGHEDILFDGDCNAWVSNTGRGGGLDKFSSSGAPLGTYIPGQRTDWIDLASDQRTMFYTHEGQGSDAVLRADVSSFPGTLLTDFVTLPSGPNRVGYAVKFLPDGGILVADREDILRYTSTGQFVRSYDAPGHDDFFGMCLGLGGTSVWAVDLVQQDIVNIDLGTGVATITPMNDNTVFMGSVIVAGGYRAAACTPTPVCQFATSNTSNFNGTPINAGRYIWFTSVLKVQGLPSNHPVTIRFTNQMITSSSWFNLSPGDATVIFDPHATTATTVGPNTTVPSGIGGNTFFSALSYLVPANIPGGLNPVTWSGTITSDTPGVTICWQWAAAVYTTFSSDNNALGVKPVDDSKASIYKNSDHAGTPENFKQFVIGGARGGGGSNYTGSYSGTACVRCP